MTMNKLMILSMCLGLLMTVPVQASGLTQAQRLVAHDLKYYAPGTDPKSLTRAQLDHIYLIMHSRRTESDKRNLIKSAIGGPNTLRGLLFKGQN